MFLSKEAHYIFILLSQIFAYQFFPTQFVSKSVILDNAHIICPKTNKDFHGHVIIEDGIIKAVNKGNFTGEARSEIIDCHNNVLCPGLIDMQVHFRDPGQPQKEDIATGSLSAVKGGITTVVCQPNTKPTLDNTTVLDYLYYKAKDLSHCNVLAYASITKGLGGNELTDLSDLAKHRICCGFTDDGLPVMNSMIMRRVFEFSAVHNIVIAQHAEDINLSNKGCMNEGITSAKLGVRGIPNSSESIIVQRDIELLREFGGRYHVLHVSTKEALEAIRIAKKEGLKITCEVSPHHLVLTDEEVERNGTNAKMNPPLRSYADVLALQQGLIDGTIDVIATDHAPHTVEEKSQSLETAPFGIVGVETMLPIALEFYHSGKIPLPDLLSKMTYKPAQIINFDGGTLETGKRADITIIDINHKWTIDVAKFASRSKNSPFHNRNVKGKAVMTIVGGIIKFREI